jgi:SNF2 family DNA or RNA helicase
MISKNMLRRLKTDVLEELPDLIEQEIIIDMTPKQRREYDDAYNKTQDIDTKDSGSLLALINELKQICNLAPSSKESGKVEYLKGTLEELKSRKEKIIIFSQYVKSLKYLNHILDFESDIYHGSLSNEEKESVIENFKEKNGFHILYMSLKAGSVGLNLQEASTVILFDRWWNPSIESQAIARAHRMGNNKNVLALKLRTHDSIEDRIIELLHEKKALFEDIIEGAVSKREKGKLLGLLNLTNEDEK